MLEDTGRTANPPFLHSFLLPELPVSVPRVSRKGQLREVIPLIQIQERLVKFGISPPNL